MIDIKATFEKFADDEYLAFDRVEEKLHPRPDMCAFLLVDRLAPKPGHDMIDSAEHDEIWLSVDVERLARVATEADVLTLSRCGVRYDNDNESLAMFV